MFKNFNKKKISNFQFNTQVCLYLKNTLFLHRSVAAQTEAWPKIDAVKNVLSW